jgi:hypothetical protein
MRKVQVFLRDDQKLALKRLAARTGRRLSDLIRAGVDLLIDCGNDEGADWRGATRAAAGLWRDRTDIDAMAKTLRAAAKRRFGSSHISK